MDAVEPERVTRMSGHSDEPFRIRAVERGDAAMVARHRAAMFADMGVVAPPLVDQLVEMTTAYLAQAIPRGEYVGWLAAPHAEAGTIVAGAGVQVRQTLPFPRQWPDGRADIAGGHQGLAINVYTHPGYRRRGAARALMHEMLAWARRAGLESLVLHAAPDGRALYEALGFVDTNEMRFAGDLRTWELPEAAR